MCRTTTVIKRATIVLAVTLLALVATSCAAEPTQAPTVTSQSFQAPGPPYQTNSERRRAILSAFTSQLIDPMAAVNKLLDTGLSLEYARGVLEDTNMVDFPGGISVDPRGLEVH